MANYCIKMILAPISLKENLLFNGMHEFGFGDNLHIKIRTIFYI